MAYRNFTQVLRGLDVSMAGAELARQPELWEQFTTRQTYPGSAHHDTQCIVMRGPHVQSKVNVFDDIEAVAWDAMELLPECAQLALRLILAVDACALGRILVTRLKPQGAIDPHTDQGAYAQCYARFHIPIDSGEGNLFTCDGESITMQPGSAWWFNHQRPHHVINASSAWRTHLIVDLNAPGFEVGA